MSANAQAQTTGNNGFSFWGIGEYVWSFFVSDAKVSNNRPNPASPFIGEEENTELYKSDAPEMFLASPCALSGTTLNVPSGSYPTIQAAINAANPLGGDTIVVAAGTYTEQISINKCLKIQGAGQASTIIQAPLALSNSTVPGVTAQSIVEIRSNSYVTMTGLTIAGPVPFTAPTVYGVLVVENATLDVNNVRVTAIHKSTGIDGVQNGLAIGVGRTAFNQIGSLIADNLTVDNFQKNGITVDRTGSTLTISNSTVSGIGATGLIAQNGIQISRGASGTVNSGNVITGHEYTGTSASSAGILPYNAGVISIAGNNISNNDVGIYNFADSTAAPITAAFTVEGNHLSGNVEYGIIASGVNASVTNNFISGGEYGAAGFPANNNVIGFLQNSITGATSHGIYFDNYNDASPTSTADLDAHFNRIAGNAVGIQNDTGIAFDAENNFWGCNSGANGGTGCDTAVGLFDADPWLILSQTTSNATSLNNGGTATVTTSLRRNSDGVDTYALPGNPHLPNAIPVLFPNGITVAYSSNSFGSVSPTTVSLVDGLAPATTFTAGAGPYSGDQTAVVTAQVDNATDSVNITVEDTTPPTVTINQAAGQNDPTVGSPVNFTVVFSEVVTGFDASDVNTTGTTATIGTPVVTTSDNQTFNVAIPATTSGVIVANVGAGAALDPASNPNNASTTMDNQVAFFASSIELVVDDAGINCLPNGSPVYTTIQAAVAAAAPGYTIKVCPGTYPVSTGTAINLAGLTIENALPTKPDINVSGGSLIFTVFASNVTIRGLNVTKTDTTAQNVIQVQGTNFTGQNNNFTATTNWTGTGTTRAFEVSSTATGLLLDGNTITDFRQPAYINGNGAALGTISNNTATRTKGWVVDGAVLTFTNNTFGQTCQACDTDIALLPAAFLSGPQQAAYQAGYTPANIFSISQNNNNAHVDVQFTAANDSGRAQTWVDDNAPADGDGRVGTPYPRIQQAIFDNSGAFVDGTLPGGTVNVAAGTYNEDVTVSRTLTIAGTGASSTTVSGPIGGGGSTFQLEASNVDLSGFTITRAGNNTTDWNNPGLNTAGIAIQGLAFTGSVIHDNIITGMRTAIDINNSNGHTIRNNVIDNNRTGLIFRNQTDDITLVENQITNNWTVGVLFLEMSGGTNSPVQQAKYGTFSNNNISGNWYGQIVDRQTGGSIPAPGTTNLKNFQGNWFGSATPVVTTADSTEPGYAAQIPTLYGGTATAPGGQPDIAGPASANFLYKQVLPSGTDTDAGEFGFQGVPIQTTTSAVDTWFTINEGATGSAGFVPGPGGQPLGNGSGKLMVDGTGRWAIATLNYRGTRLNDITSLSYWSYREAGSGALAPSLQFDIDDDVTDANTAYQGRLVYEPYQDPANNPQTGVWQQWNVLSPTARFYGSAGSGSRPITVACPQNNPCTWAQILNLFPNAGIRASATDGRILFRAGGPWGGGFTGYVDKFDLGTGNTVTTHDFEADRPTVTINQAAGQNDPTNTSPINFTVVFSVPVTGFDGSDIALGGTASPTTAVVTEIAPNDGTTYNVAVSGMSGTGTVTATVNDAAASGVGGNSQPSTSTDNEVTYDVTAPTVTANPTTGQTSPTNNPSISFTIDFNETMTGFTQSDLAASLSNATIATFTDNNDTTYTVVVTASADGPVSLFVPANSANDPAGNGNVISNTATVVYDGTAPTVTVEGVSDPDTSSPVDFVATFSEPVSGFTSSDVVVTGSAFTSSPVAVVTQIAPNDGTTYNIAVTGMNQSGNVKVTIPASSANDAAGNGSTVSSAGTPNGDDVQFNLAVNSVTVNPTNTGPVPPAPGTITSWWGFNDMTNALAAPSFVGGPATAPLGVGSARLNTTATGKYLFFTTYFNSSAALPLSQVTALKYSSYAVDASNPANLPSLQMGIDYDSMDANTGFQGRLVFEPSNNTTAPNQPPAQSQWQNWDATNGRFWFTQGPGTATCGISSPCTMATILATYPNINIPNTAFGFIGFRSTGGGVNAVENYVDNFTIGINSADTTFDFEPAPPTVSVGDATAVTEGDSGTASVTFEVSISQASQLDTTVEISTADGTATLANDDYAQVSNQLVTIPAGQTSVNVNLNIVKGDNLVEPDESFVVNLSNPVNAVIGDGQGAATITNDDAFGTLQFSAATYSVTEGTPTASIVVTRTGGSDQAVSVTCETVAGGTATAGSDYTTTSQVISFADQDAAPKTCSIPIANDNLSEPAETVNLALSNAVGGTTIGAPSTAVLTINDNGNFILISGNIQQYNAPSPNTPLAGVTVTLSGSASATTTTDANGNYVFNGGLPAGTNNYLVVPSLSGKVFDPLNRSYVNLTANVTNADFVAYNTGAVPRNLRIVDTYQATYSSNVTVPIVLDSMGTENAMSFSLSYNPALLAFSSAACGSDAPGCSFTTNDTSGALGIEFTRGEVPPGNPTVFTAGGGRQVLLVTFTTTPGSVSSTPITFGNSPAIRDVNDVNGNSLPANYINGLVIFAQGFEGDVAGRNTGNGNLTSTDVTILRQFVSGALTTDPNYNEFQRADVAPAGSKGGGTLTSADVTTLRNYIANSTLTPVGGPSQPIVAPLAPVSLVEMAKNDSKENVVAGDVRVINVNTSAGSTITVPIELDSGNNVNGVTFSVQFDQTKLTYTGAGFGPDLVGFPNTTFDTNVTQVAMGRVGISFTINIGQTIPAGLKRIVNLNFTVNSNAPSGLSPITFVNQPLLLELNDPMGNVVTSNFIAGNVNIAPQTSANVNITGRLVSNTGRAIQNTQLILTDSNGGQRFARSNASGHFRFTDIAVGNSYVISVNSKRYRFAPQVLNVGEDVTNLVLTAEP